MWTPGLRRLSLDPNLNQNVSNHNNSSYHASSILPTVRILFVSCLQRKPSPTPLELLSFHNNNSSPHDALFTRMHTHWRPSWCGSRPAQVFAAQLAVKWTPARPAASSRPSLKRCVLLGTSKTHRFRQSAFGTAFGCLVLRMSMT